MLPLHGQDTAAVEMITGQDEPLICMPAAMFLVNSRNKGLPSSFFKYLDRFI